MFRVNTKFAKLLLIAISVLLVSWLLPTGITFADPQPNCYDEPYNKPISGDVYLNGDPTNHAGKSYQYFPTECGDIELQPGEVLWHLVLTNWVEGASATIDGVGGPNKIVGGVMHWTIINSETTAPNWKAIVTNGLEWHYVSGQDGCVLKTDLKVSHTCYGGDTTEGSITITKNIPTALTEVITFYFYITPDVSGVSEPIGITISAGQTSASYGPITAPYNIEFTVTETNIPTGWLLSSSSGNVFTLTAENNSANPTFNNEQTTTEEGSITITKNIPTALTEVITFYFDITPDVSGVSEPIGITIPAGQTSASYGPITAPYNIEFTVTETNIPTGWLLSSSSGNVFTLTAENNSANPTFNNEQTTNGNGTNGNGDEHCDKCSLVVLKRDETGNAIDGAVFEVDGVRKTIKDGKARWDNLECDTTYEVKEISPNDYREGIHLGDCGERSTLRVVNKGEEYLEVLGIMEVLPFTGPAIPYSPFIGISTVLAGTFLYILSKSKKKR